MSCTALDQLRSEDTFSGGYSCSPSGSGGSLSAGAKAGIAIGVIIAILLVLFIAWYMLRRRRLRKHRRPEPTDVSPVSPPLSPVTPAIVRDEKLSSPKYQPVPVHEPLLQVPRKPLGPLPAQLDGRSVYEAPIAATPILEYHELEAEPVLSTHQRPIHSDT